MDSIFDMINKSVEKDERFCEDRMREFLGKFSFSGPIRRFA